MNKNKTTPGKASPKVVVRRLHIPANAARPTPPVGPVLSELKVNIKAFCDDFNAATSALAGSLLPVDIIVSPGGKYEYRIHKPTATELIKKAFNIKKGASSPKREKFMDIKYEDLRSVAEHKQEDLTHDIEAAMRTLASSASSMGINVMM